MRHFPSMTELGLLPNQRAYVFQEDKTGFTAKWQVFHQTTESGRIQSSIVILRNAFLCLLAPINACQRQRSRRAKSPQIWEFSTINGVIFVRSVSSCHQCVHPLHTPPPPLPHGPGGQQRFRNLKLGNAARFSPTLSCPKHTPRGLDLVNPEVGWMAALLLGVRRQEGGHAGTRGGTAQLRTKTTQCCCCGTRGVKIHTLAVSVQEKVEWFIISQYGPAAHLHSAL